MSKMMVDLVHISMISAGDTVEHYGELRTVCENNIRRGAFMVKRIKFIKL